MTLHVSYVKHMHPISINSRKTCGPYWRQQQKNTRTLSAPTAQKHMDHYQHQQQKNTWTLASTAKKIDGPLTQQQKNMDLISINSRKTHGCYRHQQHKNTWMLSAERPVEECLGNRQTWDLQFQKKRKEKGRPLVKYQWL